MKAPACIAVVLCTLTPQLFAQELHLPFSGRWFVMAAGDTPNVNHHMSVRAQWYAIDFMKVGGPEGRSLSKGDGKTIEDFYSWGASVQSPADGEIEAVTDGLPDNPLGVQDKKNIAGNNVVIKVSGNQYLFLCHFQKGSIKVKKGDRVKAGQVLGKCGNSGNTTSPHIHLHMQNTSTFNQGAGQNMTFKGIDVELTGKQFEDVEWPLITGLFVANH